MRILIVGAGIAGISASRHLMSLGVNVKVVNAKNWLSSTAVATGMINPIVFKRINKSWKVDDLLPYAWTFYSSLKTTNGRSVIEHVELEKKVPSKDYQTMWENRMKEPGMETYLGPISNGFAPVKGSMMIDCHAMVKDYLSQLGAKKILDTAPLEYEELIETEAGFIFRSEQYDRVVFCEGPYAVNNPWFNYLPWKLSKGEWIVVVAEIELKDKILNDVLGIVPMGDHKFKVSSTFEWEQLDWQPSEKGRQQLSKAFKKTFNVPFKIIDHQAGIRPSVADRRPFLGEHPEQKGMYIFNGLGTKGLLLAPFFGNQLAEHLINGKSLDKEVSISRFSKRFKR